MKNCFRLIKLHDLWTNIEKKNVIVSFMNRMRRNVSKNSKQSSVNSRKLHMEPLEERTLLSLDSLSIGGINYDVSADNSSTGWSWDFDTQTLKLNNYVNGAILATYNSADASNVLNLDLGTYAEGETQQHHMITTETTAEGLKITNGKLKLIGSNTLSIYGGIQVLGNGTTGANITTDANWTGSLYYGTKKIDYFASTYTDVSLHIKNLPAGSKETIMVTNDLVWDGSETAKAPRFIVDNKKDITLISSGNWTITATTATTARRSILSIHSSGGTTVDTDCVLSLGTETRFGSSTLTIDGHYYVVVDGVRTITRSSTASLIRNAGTFNMYDGVIVTNNSNSTDTPPENGVPKNTCAAIFNFGPDQNSSSKTQLDVDEYGNPTADGAANRSVFNMYGGTISDCIGTRGGAVSNYGIMNLMNGTISGNTATIEGGGIYNRGYIFMTGGTITNSVCSVDFNEDSPNAGKGGGIHNSKYAFINISGGLITKNSADRGGGIYAGGSGHAILNIQGGEISHNSATGYWYKTGNGTYIRIETGTETGSWLGDGGGIWANSTVQLYGGTIAYNTTRLDRGNGIYINLAEEYDSDYNPVVLMSGAGSVSTTNQVYVGSLIRIESGNTGPLIPIRVTGELTTPGSVMLLATDKVNQIWDGVPIIVYAPNLLPKSCQFTLDDDANTVSRASGTVMPSGHGTLPNYVNTAYGVIPYSQTLVVTPSINDNNSYVRFGDMFFPTFRNATAWNALHAHSQTWRYDQSDLTDGGTVTLYINAITTRNYTVNAVTGQDYQYVINDENGNTGYGFVKEYGDYTKVKFVEATGFTAEANATEYFKNNYVTPYVASLLDNGMGLTEENPYIYYVTHNVLLTVGFTVNMHTKIVAESDTTKEEIRRIVGDNVLDLNYTMHSFSYEFDFNDTKKTNSCYIAIGDDNSVNVGIINTNSGQTVFHHANTLLHMRNVPPKNEDIFGLNSVNYSIYANDDYAILSYRPSGQYPNGTAIGTVVSHFYKPETTSFYTKSGTVANNDTFTFLSVTYTVHKSKSGKITINGSDGSLGIGKYDGVFTNFYHAHSVYNSYSPKDVDNGDVFTVDGVTYTITADHTGQGTANADFYATGNDGSELIGITVISLLNESFYSTTTEYIVEGSSFKDTVFDFTKYSHVVMGANYVPTLTKYSSAFIWESSGTVSLAVSNSAFVPQGQSGFFTIVDNSSLILGDGTGYVTFNGNYQYSNNGPLFYLSGGKLTLSENTFLRNNRNDYSEVPNLGRHSGTITLDGNSTANIYGTIIGCAGDLAGGIAIVSEDATLNLYGGTITGCSGTQVEYNGQFIDPPTGAGAIWNSSAEITQQKVTRFYLDSNPTAILHSIYGDITNNQTFEVNGVTYTIILNGTAITINGNDGSTGTGTQTDGGDVTLPLEWVQYYLSETSFHNQKVTWFYNNLGVGITSRIGSYENSENATPIIWYYYTAAATTSTAVIVTYYLFNENGNLVLRKTSDPTSDIVGFGETRDVEYLRTDYNGGIINIDDATCFYRESDGTRIGHIVGAVADGDTVTFDGATYTVVVDSNAIYLNNSNGDYIGYGVYNQATISENDGIFGGIYNKGTIVMNGGVITNNTNYHELMEFSSRAYLFNWATIKNEPDPTDNTKTNITIFVDGSLFMQDDNGNMYNLTAGVGTANPFYSYDYGMNHVKGVMVLDNGTEINYSSDAFEYYYDCRGGCYVKFFNVTVGQELLTDGKRVRSGTISDGITFHVSKLTDDYTFARTSDAMKMKGATSGSVSKVDLPEGNSEVRDILEFTINGTIAMVGDTAYAERQIAYDNEGNRVAWMHYNMSGILSDGTNSYHFRQADISYEYIPAVRDSEGTVTTPESCVVNIRVMAEDTNYILGTSSLNYNENFILDSYKFEAIRENIAVWQDGIMEIGGSAVIDTSNIVYLFNDCTLDINTRNITINGSNETKGIGNRLTYFTLDGQENPFYSIEGPVTDGLTFTVQSVIYTVSITGGTITISGNNNSTGTGVFKTAFYLSTNTETPIYTKVGDVTDGETFTVDGVTYTLNVNNTTPLDFSVYNDNGIRFDSTSQEPTTILVNAASIADAKAINTSGILNHIRQKYVIQNVDEENNLRDNIVILYSTLTYDANNGSSEGAIKYTTVDRYYMNESVTTISFEATNLDPRTGYLFVGWNTEADGTGEWYFPRSNDKSKIIITDVNTTIYAQWSSNIFSTIKDNIVDDHYRSLRESVIISQYSEFSEDHYIIFPEDYTKWEQYTGNGYTDSDGWTFGFPDEMKFMLTKPITSNTAAEINSVMTHYYDTYHDGKTWTPVTSDMKEITSEFIFNTNDILTQQYTGTIEYYNSENGTASTIFTNNTSNDSIDTINTVFLTSVQGQVTDGATITLESGVEYMVLRKDEETNPIRLYTAKTQSDTSDDIIVRCNANNYKFYIEGNVQNNQIYPASNGNSYLIKIVKVDNIDTIELWDTTNTELLGTGNLFVRCGSGTYYTNQSIFYFPVTSSRITPETETNEYYIDQKIAYIKDGTVTNGDEISIGNAKYIIDTTTTATYTTKEEVTYRMVLDAQNKSRHFMVNVTEDISDNTVIIAGLQFVNGQTTNGASFFIKSGIVDIASCKFLDNVARSITNGAYGYGGSIAVTTSNATVNITSINADHLEGNELYFTTFERSNHNILGSSVIDGITHFYLPETTSIHTLNGSVTEGQTFTSNSINYTIHLLNNYIYAVAENGDIVLGQTRGGTVYFYAQSDTDVKQITAPTDGDTFTYNNILYTIHVGDDGTIATDQRSTAAYGGAIYNYGNTTVDCTAITGLNATKSGGAIYNSGYGTYSNGVLTGTLGTLSVIYSFISQNKAVEYGGAIANYGICYINEASRIDYNEAGFNGGAICNGYMITTEGVQSHLYVGTEVRILNNKALGTVNLDETVTGGYGGGVINSSLMDVNGALFLDNWSSVNGGGISNSKYHTNHGTSEPQAAYGVLNINDSSSDSKVFTVIMGNTTRDYGGGIGSWGDLNIKGNTSIIDNTAAYGKNVYARKDSTSEVNITGAPDGVLVFSPIEVSSPLNNTIQIPYDSLNSNTSLLLNLNNNGEFTSVGTINTITPADLGLSPGTYQFDYQFITAQGIASEIEVMTIIVQPPVGYEDTFPTLSVEKSVFADGQFIKLDIEAFTVNYATIQTWSIHWGEPETEPITIENLSNRLTIYHYYPAQNETQSFELTLQLIDNNGKGENVTYYLLTHTVPGTETQNAQAVQNIETNLTSEAPDAILTVEIAEDTHYSTSELITPQLNTEDEFVFNPIETTNFLLSIIPQSPDNNRFTNIVSPDAFNNFYAITKDDFAIVRLDDYQEQAVDALFFDPLLIDEEEDWLENLSKNIHEQYRSSDRYSSDLLNELDTELLKY